jgi:riboflavin kinase / FMN adenylyltransferase
MKTYLNDNDISSKQTVTAVTIGNFDGVHLGHQSILNKINSLKSCDGKSLVMTFKNHPKTVLRPKDPLFLISSFQHKLKLLENYDVDFVLAPEFNLEFASQTPQDFLRWLHKLLGFSYLVLGPDARFGKNREGSPEIVQSESAKLGFELIYLPRCKKEKQSISSSLIRQTIEQGDFKKLEIFLGRPYSLLSKVCTGKGKGQALGFPTANLNVKGFCLPPLGVYIVSLICDNQTLEGIANLGVAPTLKNTEFPTLEVHLLDHSSSLYEKSVEVIFHDFLRPETKFESLEALKKQISYDAQLARDFFSKL